MRGRIVVWSSAAALAAVLILWTTSYHRFVVFSHEGRVHVLMVRQDQGVDKWLRRTHLSAADLSTFRTPGLASRVVGVEVGPQLERIQQYSYEIGERSIYTSLSIRYRLVSAPYWLAALAAAAPAAALLPGVLRRRAWRRTGRCAGCGYDVRATPDRCPECGAVPAGRVAA